MLHARIFPVSFNLRSHVPPAPLPAAAAATAAALATATAAAAAATAARACPRSLARSLAQRERDCCATLPNGSCLKPLIVR